MKQKNLHSIIEEEYLRHNEDEDDEMYFLKEAIKNTLNPIERKIFITYLENGTYTATAKLYNVSTPTLSTYINDLKTKIIDYVDKHHTEPTTDKPDSGLNP